MSGLIQLFREYMPLPVKSVLHGIGRKASPDKQQLRLIKQLSTADPISDFDTFRSMIAPFLHSSRMITSGRYGEEAYFYGYYDSMLGYSGVKKAYIPAFVRLEHGVRFGTEPWFYDQNALTYACQGPERVSEISGRDPDIPVFVLGPYILYADDYYDEERFRRKKEELGKTLLVFPRHTFELSGNKRVSDRLADTIYTKYSGQFDTIMVCAYWNDVDDPVLDIYRERGAVLVSAGFRGDRHFIERLKTVIKLSDLVIGDNLGTNMGFCLALKKRFVLCEADLSGSGLKEEYIDEFLKAFSSDDGTFTDEQLSMQNELYERFWGGERYMLSPEQMKALIKQLHKIYRDHLYSITPIRNALKKHLERGGSSCGDPVYRYHLMNRWTEDKK